MPAVAILKLALVLAAADFHEKSKVAFYILAGLLAAWAVLVSFAGLRRPDFPDTPQIARAVMGISIALPVATAATAVLTASIPPSVPPYNNGKAPVNGSKGQVAPQTQLASAAAPATAPAPAGAVGLPGHPRMARIAADPSGQLAFVQKNVSVKAGKVTLTFANSSPLAHNLTLQGGTGATGPFVGGTATFTGGTRKLTVTLKPGTYTFYCSVPGHRQAGMQGTLTVQ